jgi:hypothetical protein
MLKAPKSLEQKNSEKILFLEKSFFYFFASGLSPYNDAFLTYSAKSTNKFENAGHMRPGPWKSCHPREEK